MCKYELRSVILKVVFKIIALQVMRFLQMHNPLFAQMVLKSTYKLQNWHKTKPKSQIMFHKKSVASGFYQKDFRRLQNGIGHKSNRKKVAEFLIT